MPCGSVSPAAYFIVADLSAARVELLAFWIVVLIGHHTRTNVPNIIGASVEFAPSFVSYLAAQCGPGGFGYNWHMLTLLFGYRVGKREEFRDDIKTN